MQARSATTGKVRFRAAQPGAALARASKAEASRPAGTVAATYLRDRKESFGLAGSTLREERTAALPWGGVAVRFQQLIDGVPVFGGELIVHLSTGNDVLAVMGEAEPSAAVGTASKLTAEQAEHAARPGAAAAQSRDLGLRIYDNRLTGGPGTDAPRLVRAVLVRRGAALRQLVLVDARSGAVVTRINEVPAAKRREVCDGENRSGAQIPCLDPVLEEGGAYGGTVADVQRAYAYAGATYDYYRTRFGRDSLDDSGLTLRSTVRGCDPDDDCPMENAFWNGEQMVYGTGYAQADDVVGHELTHGVTDYSSNLVYANESGAINEALSDIFGEFIDQTTPGPDDGPGDRWEIGESLPGGAIRDMADPTHSDQPQPDSTDSPLYYDGEQDHGGVHVNSGVANKAAYLMADGGDFRGQHVEGIGIEKTARAFYAAQTAFLTSGSDYTDLGTYLRYACDQLTGTHGITGGDCQQVRRAVLATRMAPRESLSAHIELPLGGIRAGTQFTATASGSVAGADPIASYAWSFSDGTTSSAVSPSHTFSSPGPAYVNLTVTDAGGATSSLARTFTVRRAQSAFVDLPGCLDNVLAANDDGYTNRVDLPFTAKFFGEDENSLFVNNNGNVTFDSQLSTYTPFDLGTTNHGIIAPFFADVDTRSSGSDQVRYGRATFAGRPAFCVNWDGLSGVGYYNTASDKLNRFQLLLVDRSDVGNGDFDIYFNYDSIQWETGSASGGSGGRGGTPARAGYANGTQAANTTFEIPGSATSGAFLDGAPTALATTSSSSTLPGRYVFPVRNGLPPSRGRIHGRVLEPSAVPNAIVQVCLHATSTCVVTRSSSTGTFSAIGLAEGDYDITASPPSGDLFHVAGTAAGVHVAAGTDVEQDVSLTPLLGGPPASTTVSSAATLPDGSPILPWDGDVVITTEGCPEGTGHFTMSRGSTVLRDGPLQPVSGQPGHFRGTTPPLRPLIGYVTVQVSVSGCSSPGADRSTSFGAYIDPSGRVVTVDGDPVPGAKVTLLRSDASSGPFEAVPDGSDIMAPTNRHNPDLTDATGHFGWDVIAGYYQVKAEHEDCRDAVLASQPFTLTGVLAIPPPVTDLDLRMDCDATATVPASSDFGAQRVGTRSAARTVELSTAGLGRVTVTGVDVTGPDATDYELVASHCDGAIAPAQKCGVDIAFKPSAAGPRAATLSFATKGATKSVTLAGTGEAPPPVTPTATATATATAAATATATVAPPAQGTSPGVPVAPHGAKRGPCVGKSGRAARRCRAARKRRAALRKCAKRSTRKARARCRAKVKRR